MRKHAVCVLVAALLASSFAEIRAQEQESETPYALAIRGGTLGLGLELTRAINENFNVRLSGSYFQYSPEIDATDIDYDSDLTMMIGLGLVDWYPAAGKFRITAGAALNGSQADGTGTPKGPTDIGGYTLSPAQIGTVDADVTFSSFAPYVGIGWGNAVAPDRKWGFLFDLGVIIQQAPEIELTANGPYAGDARVQDWLREQEQDAQDDLDMFKMYPVVSLGFSYHF